MSGPRVVAIAAAVALLAAACAGDAGRGPATPGPGTEAGGAAAAECLGLAKDACRDNPSCEAIPFWGESFAPCKVDARGFADNCPFEGCRPLNAKCPKLERMIRDCPEACPGNSYSIDSPDGVQNVHVPLIGAAYPMRASRVAVVLMILLSCVGCDQATKVAARGWLSRSPPVNLLGGTLRLEYTENTGAFLGLGAGLPDAVRTGLFVFGAGLLLVLALGYALLGRGLRPSAVGGMALIGAGGVGNLIDRIALGAVSDFVSIGVGGLRTGIFNVADLAITTGAVAVVWALARPQERPDEGLAP